MRLLTIRHVRWTYSSPSRDVTRLEDRFYALLNVQVVPQRVWLHDLAIGLPAGPGRNRCMISHARPAQTFDLTNEPRRPATKPASQVLTRISSVREVVASSGELAWGTLSSMPMDVLSPSMADAPPNLADDRFATCWE